MLRKDIKVWAVTCESSCWQVLLHIVCTCHCAGYDNLPRNTESWVKCNANLPRLLSRSTSLIDCRWIRRGFSRECQISCCLWWRIYNAWELSCELHACEWVLSGLGQSGSDRLPDFWNPVIFVNIEWSNRSEKIPYCRLLHDFQAIAFLELSCICESVRNRRECSENLKPCIWSTSKILIEFRVLFCTFVQLPHVSPGFKQWVQLRHWKHS